MGQAKQRGTFEERKALAMERNAVLRRERLAKQAADDDAHDARIAAAHAARGLAYPPPRQRHNVSPLAVLALAALSMGNTRRLMR